MKTKNYFASVSIVMGKTRTADFEFGPYTRKRDLIRGMERTLPENFRLQDGYIRVENDFGFCKNVEEISGIGNGKIQTWESPGFIRIGNIKYHTYKFGK